MTSRSEASERQSPGLAGPDEAPVDSVWKQLKDRGAEIVRLRTTRPSTVPAVVLTWTNPNLARQAALSSRTSPKRSWTCLTKSSRSVSRPSGLAAPACCSTSCPSELALLMLRCAATVLLAPLRCCRTGPSGHVVKAPAPRTATSHPAAYTPAEGENSSADNRAWGLVCSKDSTPRLVTLPGTAPRKRRGSGLEHAEYVAQPPSTSGPEKGLAWGQLHPWMAMRPPAQPPTASDWNVAAESGRSVVQLA